MEKNKGRDYMFDAFRGILMLSIPMSHFTKMSGNLYASLYTGGGFETSSLAGFVYVTINVFVMQAFMFLSGYFSKKVKKSRETAFKTFMWPYLVFTFVYFIIRYMFFGNAHLDFLTPPFALWFLFTLFFYRYFLGDMIKFKWLLPFSLVMMLIAGQVSEFNSFMALGRLFSYFPFFLFGFYCSKERLACLRHLKKKPLVLTLLGIILVAISILFINFGPSPDWYLLKSSVQNFNMPWYADTLLRIAIVFVSSGWIILMINIIPNRQSFLTLVGANTMPVYIFHLTLRYVISSFGLYIGAISCLTVAWFSAVSLVFKKISNKGLYALVIILSLIGWYALFNSGYLTPLIGLCPENRILFYLLLYGSSLLAGASFVAPLWIKLYDILVNVPMQAFLLVERLKGPKKMI